MFTNSLTVFIHLLGCFGVERLVGSQFIVVEKILFRFGFEVVDAVEGGAVDRVLVQAPTPRASKDKIVQSLPFAVRSIQVDGGSEFRGAWEAACQARGIALLVLPPKSPKYNGCVERAHRSLRQELYATYRLDWRLDTLNRALAQFQHHYCTHRPHGGKHRNLMTPMAYYQQIAEAA